MNAGERVRSYFKRVIDFPGIVRVPEGAKLDALVEAGGRVLAEEETEHQRVLLIETPRGELMLLLDGQLQFYSYDEHRYHEALALVPFLYAREPVRRVGVMGGGDGLIVRELLRHHGDEIESIRVVDIDPAVTDLARNHPRLAELNEGSFRDPRVEVVNRDARAYRSNEPFDLIICDLPDPTSSVLARLYHREFYAGLREQLDPERGLLTVQIPYVPPVFDGVLTTLRSVFPAVRESGLRMYSFVHVGFGLAGVRRLERCRQLPSGTRYLTPETVEGLFYFPPDEQRAEISEPATDENERVLEWYAAYLRDHVEERILYF